MSLTNFGSASLIALAMLFLGDGLGFSQENYCGVYCAFSVLDEYQRTIDFESLLLPKYIGGYQGSRASEVAGALSDHGVRSWICNGLGSFDLKLANRPLVLHVRASQGMREYAHWVVYNGERDGQALLFDPSRGDCLMTYPELLSMWDGVAVATAETRMEFWMWRGLSTATRRLELFALGLVAIPLLRLLKVIVSPADWIQTSIKAVMLLGVVLTATAGLDLVRSEGILRNPVARGSISSVIVTPPVSEIETPEAIGLFQQSLAGHSPVAWIDARFMQDFKVGHIPGAINIPVDADFRFEETAAARIGATDRVVVYCQSPGCGFSGAVVQRLKARGFTNIAIFRGGYGEWAASNQPIAH